MKPLSIGSVVKNVVGKLGGTAPLVKEMEEAWAAAAKGGLGGHARLTSLKNGRLIVLVDSSAWLHSAAVKRGELLGALNARLGQELVKELVFKIGEVPPVSGIPSTSTRKS